MFLASLVGWLVASLLRSAAFSWPGREPASEIRGFARAVRSGGNYVAAGCFGISSRARGPYPSSFWRWQSTSWERKGRWKPVGPHWACAIAGVAIAEWWKFGLTAGISPPRGLPGHARNGPACRVGQPTGDPAGARRLVRTLSLESDCGGGGRNRLPRSQCTSAGLVGQAPGCGRRGDSDRDALRRRRIDPAGIRQPAAGPRWLPDSRGLRAGPRRLRSWDGWSSSCASTRLWPTAWRWRRSGLR